MRVPTRSAGTRSGVNWRRLKEPPSTSATVLTVRVLARPGTPSSSTWPPASSATMTRSSIASCPTITRLISNSADSRALWAVRAAVPSSASRSNARRRRSSVTPSSPVLLGGADAPGLGPERHVQGTPIATALDHDGDLVAGLAGVDGGGHVVGSAHARAADRDDHVAALQAGLGGGAAGDDVADRRAARGGGLRRHAEEGVPDALALLEGGEGALDRVDRDREADARVLVAAAVGLDLRVDADHAALRV